MIGDETSLNEDSKDDIKWNRHEVLSLWNKACHLAEKLEQVANGLEAAKENYRNEIEDWRKEREEQVIRERKILEESEELRKELQAWMNQNITARPRTASFSSHVQPSCEEIVSYTTDIIDSMWPNAFSPLESDEEDAENVEQVDESTVEENNAEESEAVETAEETEQQENQETTENEDETAENEEETVEVLEYTPVASTVEV
ncbi:hypothetical protein TNIN_203501 [Trichonephila inaurata madagascariensis]|uniref:Uncharacterized protein n=1 Tax=Trichonephila inaurata madagascariensis TaxID=2747483 RepID=A0A8X6WT99_9ARAC|nr:hypothetical protein TNIN_203501 [Trichonephila inaurata madagascariensis]